MTEIQLQKSKWKIEESSFLGRPGGFGQVHSGSGPTGENVAVKVLSFADENDAKRELKFAEEFVGKQTTYIVPILDYGVDLNLKRACIVMKRGERNLRDYIVSVAKISESDAAQIVIQIANGLLEAGAWIHRDLKPENVILLEGRWQLVDFGIARVADASTSVNTLKGYLTPQYAAPEQWDRRRATHATDVYALGCIGCELFSGRLPFSGPSYEDLADQHRLNNPVIGTPSAPIRSLLLRMLSKIEAARPPISGIITELNKIVHVAQQSKKRSMLAEAGAEVAEATFKQEAAAQIAANKKKRRSDLKVHALGLLRELAGGLFERIQEDAPQTSLSVAGSTLLPIREARLGRGRLSMSIGQFSEISEETFRTCKWDVICGDYIVVETTRYTRSASLWFADRGDGQFRWLETAYWRFSRGDSAREPCFLPPGRDADYAASNVTHIWNLAYQPRLIEGDQQDVFWDRWITFFAEAARGTLTHPGRMPED